MTTDSSLSLRRALCAAALVTASSGAALADPPDTDRLPSAPVSGAQTAGSGAYLPWGVPARIDSQRAFALVRGGYDTARGGAVFDTSVQATIVGPLSLRGGAAYVGPDGALRPSVSLALQALHQSRQGVDLTVYGGYEAQGFNTVPAANVIVALGRSFGRLTLLTNVGYGYGLDDGEHYGEARVGGVVRVLPSLHVGLDARGRIDLERDSDEPTGEPDWELLAGPNVAWSIDRFTVSASGGVSTIKFRASDAVATGAVVNLMLGSAF